MRPTPARDDPPECEELLLRRWGGFAIMDTLNFPQWRNNVPMRVKVSRILAVFQDVLEADMDKCVIAPCSNCKGTLREALRHYGLEDKYRIHYTGLADLMVNAMADLPRPYIEWNPGGIAGQVDAGKKGKCPYFYSSITYC